MILRRSLLQQHALLKTTASSVLTNTSRPTFAAQQCRRVHNVPQIGEFDKQFHNDGIDKLLSPDAFRLAWTEYQQYLVDRMNTISAGNTKIDDRWDVKSLAMATARDPSLASIFNYASMAHNNHFFFQCLAPTETDIPKDLKEHLTRSFGSVDNFRSEFLESASGMFGPGFTWLVQDHQPSPNSPSVLSDPQDLKFTTRLHFKILNTYIAGSPYPGAHNRQQNLDMNARNLLSSSDDHRRMSTPQNRIGAFGGGMGSVPFSSARPDEEIRFGGANITPVLCVNTWPHVWMWDWGVAGKRGFLAEWWRRINWEHVWTHCEKTQVPYGQTRGNRPWAK